MKAKAQASLPLLSLLSTQHKIFVEVVPFHLAIDDRALVYIVIAKTVGNEVTRFQLPVQWSSNEAAVLIHQIKGISWQLNDDGVPINYERIIEICEDFVNEQLPIEFRFRDLSKKNHWSKDWGVTGEKPK